jgi:two-component system, chemotaxis family, protein-glutamate methylesterase/glutaminase
MKTENTQLTCPECGGAIQRLEQDDGLTQYRCRVGHLYSPKSALAVHADREENTLWSAVVLLEEGAELAEEVSKQPAINDSKSLRKVSIAKRHLANRVKEALSAFGEISLPLE